MGTLRFSTGKPTTRKEIEQASRIMAAKIHEMQGSTATGTGPSGQQEKVRLTMYTHGLGCACKLSASELEPILSRIRPADAPEVLIDARTADDAAVYRISEDTALVQTVDFFTPMVDEPVDFGAIAAANALSDIYAMGATPIFALNIVGFPTRRLSIQALEQILEGAGEVAAEAGISILGGHSIENPEPVFGMVVNGTAQPGNILSNAGAREGDALILTKPLGTGIITTAIKKGQASTDQQDLAIRSMKQLNRDASRTMKEFPVNACTDVTGFGLLGHLLEMVKASRVSARIFAGKVPVFPGAPDLALAKMIPGGTSANMNHTASHSVWDQAVGHPMKIILNDAQTSGGLLISVPGEHAEKLLSALHKQGMTDSALIGEITARSSSCLYIG
jgi:selenium donor protein